MQRDSDLIGIPVTLGAIFGVLVILAAFFFIGPLVGIIAVLAVLALAVVAAIRLIGKNEVRQ